jgi:cbb3-type cytochrome oxidase subunit 3
MLPILASLAEKTAGASKDADVERWKAIFSVAALVVALVGFLAVVAYLLLKRNRKVYERAKRLPLEDD